MIPVTCGCADGNPRPIQYLEINFLSPSCRNGYEFIELPGDRREVIQVNIPDRFGKYTNRNFRKYINIMARG
jgi:hypothetical protein